MTIKPTRAQTRLIKRIRRHGPLCHCRGDTESWFHLANGESVHTTVAQNLIDRGLVTPQNDGLLVGHAQTYRVAS